MSPRVVLITGCSSGIGRALAQECAARGHRVYATARRQADVADLQDEGIAALELDVVNGDAQDRVLERIAAETGGVDILVNNAGFGAMGPLLDLPAQALRQQFETNVVAPLELARKTVPAMVRRGGGKVVNIGSVAGLFTTPFAGAYSASKAALNSATEALHMELAPLGVQVMLVRAGAVRQRAGASQVWAQSTQACARRITNAMLAVRMPAMLAVGRGGYMLPMLSRYVPWALRARMLSRRFGLAALEDR